MCGIYSILSATRIRPPPRGELARCAGTLMQTIRPQGAGGDFLREDAEDLAERVLQEAERFMGRGGLIACIEDASKRAEIARVVEGLRHWLEGLEAAGREAEPGFPIERLNRIGTAIRDALWKLERDVLEGVEGIRGLVRHPAEPALGRAYELHLVLRGLDRLEVRGRDSAGLAIYARFGDPGRLEAFLAAGGGKRARDVARRYSPRFVAGAVLRPPSAPGVLLLAHKVASEVGKMGDNVRALRSAITGDTLLQDLLAEPDVEIQFLAHTRWASNGLISEANCHPVDSTLLREGEPVPETVGAVVAALNGDIDNYPELVRRYVTEKGWEIDSAITTDAKIVPVVLQHFRGELGDPARAVKAALDTFEGSMAIAAMFADRPGELYCAQKGSGQGLFFAAGEESVAAASEVYGVVELAARCLKAEGDRRPGGEVFRLVRRDETVEVAAVVEDGLRSLEEKRWRRAEITTRDINRGRYEHFFLKEITESVESVRRTLRGKYRRTRDGVRFLLGEESLPARVIEGLKSGLIRRIAVIGQGTAAVAGEGVAFLLSEALGRLDPAPEIRAEKATEFSAYGLRPDMRDTLVVAVSQSGTTTDTNRTVDLARERGACVLAIVNRRNSDLVYKADGVLYTSDGRDVEMSVASTKAFYSQNVAGRILSLALAAELGTLGEGEIAAALDELERLPSCLEGTLELAPRIASLARAHALKRRHWAVVGSGPAKIAADEVRIKLSELCYKSIAIDFLEDKKHIDLSSEPLVLVCATGLDEALLSDTVKEVAIFKAHKAVPIVIASADPQPFAPYSAGAVEVPATGGTLAYLPAAMAGHLFGYHAARAMDEKADLVRKARAELVSLLESAANESAGDLLGRFASRAAESLQGIDESLAAGELDAALGAGTAVRLARALDLSLGRLRPERLPGRYLADKGGVIGVILDAFSEAVAELSRPIDAIRHQAKTVTVGISRGARAAPAGVLFRALSDLGIDPADLQEHHRAFLEAFEPLVAEVEGTTLYRIEGLDPLGSPLEGSTIAVERKTGCAASIRSRCETPAPLAGNKWAAVKHRELYLGRGQVDGRKVLMIPLLGEGTRGRLALFHLELVPKGPPDVRLRALRARGAAYDRLKALITERNIAWDASLLELADNDTLFLETPERAAEAIARALHSP